MKMSHWKIRNLDNRKAYYVPIYKDGTTVLDQLVSFMKQHDIAAKQCRIIESTSRFLNMSFEEFMWKQLL